MKVLYIGGVKSGKSRLAMEHALKLSPRAKPLYLATTDKNDASMKERILAHQKTRGDLFDTIEEPLEIERISLVGSDTILIDCLTLWISNMMLQEKSLESMQNGLEKVLDTPKNILFILNDVGSGIHADSALGRRFADFSGIIAQQVAGKCDEVYHCIAGIGTRIK